MAALVAPLAGQDVPVPPAFRAGIDVVTVDVSVLSRDRRPVRGLTAGDFAVTEDGKPRRIVAFSAIDVPVAQTSGASWLREIRADVTTNDLAARRLNVIVMDDATGRTEPAIAENTRRIAHRVVDALGPADLAAVVFTNSREAEHFTADRERLRRTIDAFTTKPAAGDVARCPARRCVASTIGRLTAIFSAVPDRRKTIFYISTNGAGGLGSGSLQTIQRLAQWANVTIHALDPSGLADMARIGSSPNPAAALRALQQRHDALRELSESTGGRAIVNSNDPAAAINDVLAESQTYYLIGFERATGEDDGRLHTIDVTVNRRDAEVRARRGYYIQTGAQAAAVAAMGGTPVDLLAAIQQPLPNAGVALSIAAAPLATADLGKATVALAVGVRQRVAADQAAEEIRTVAAAFDREGRTRGWRQESLSLSLPTDGDGVVRYEILSRLELEPGTYDVRVSLSRAVDGRTGSVFTTIDIPDYAAEPLSMSGLILESTAQPVTAPLNVVEDVVPLVPTSLREFRATDQAHVLARVYQGGSEPARSVTLSGRVIDATGSTKFEQSTPMTSVMFETNRSAEGVFELPLASLSAGSYLLRVEAATDVGRTVVKELRFEMR